ncbi:MAG: FAD-dependent oxidoreductase [Spirochaetes bacterium]|nr:FAD-dependent oxidoreductase [Spirochaetota bacterium]
MEETMQGRYDVIVAGGGSAGICAALQAARAGARTALIEMTGVLGGTTTAGGVNFPGLFHAWGKQVIKGIGWELVEKTVALDRGIMPDFSGTPKRHWEQQVHINPYVFACVSEEECLRAGVSLRYHEIMANLSYIADAWHVDTIGKSGVAAHLTAKEIIDCTGDADIIRMSGYACETSETRQPGTLMISFDGYDINTLDRDRIDEEYRKALSDGRLIPGDFAQSKTAFMPFLRGHGGNQVHIFGADSSTAAKKTDADIRGRAAALRLLRFMRTLPGCEKTFIKSMSLTTGIRETYRIAGEYTITHDDYISGRKFDDSVCYSFYPIDVHDENGVIPKPLNPGTVPSVPLRALIPAGSGHILAAGRIISSDRLANSALRIQATCMATGQAAGAAAALASHGGITPSAVAQSELRTILETHGAIIPV